MDWETLPDGKRFCFWDDTTEYSRVYHVSQNHAQASDDNPGTQDEPFATIGRAAQVLEPGQKVIVHQGVYREHVAPVRGGTGPDCMIAYEAAPGENVVIKGSRVWKPQAQPSAGWRLPACAGGATVWMADLPQEFFAGYNPFSVRNVYDYLSTYGALDDKAWVDRALLRRGMVFVDGRPLKQVKRADELAQTDGAFWVEEPGLRLHFRLPEDRDPHECLIEVTTCEQVFAPRRFGLGYVRVSGFRIEHAADGLPVPQRACVSAMRGHHWILEDNHIEWANAVGVDVGQQSWDAALPETVGHHIIRRNTIRHCGICGIAGAMGVEHTLIEDNLIEHIGHHDLERLCECAGIKFHFCKHSLMRRNVLRHIQHAGGIWLDVGNVNCRITNNVFADIETITGCIFSEMNYELNLVDHNLIWDVRGYGIRADCNEKLVVAHNFIGFNNVFYRCPHRVQLGRREENRSDGNLFDAADASCSFGINYPEPSCYQDLAGWRDYFGLDVHSTQVRVEADFEPESLTLKWCVEGEEPVCQPLGLLGGRADGAVPGPMDPQQWQRGLNGQQGSQTFPLR